MQRKTFVQLLLPALGYMLMGNLMATVMTISLASFALNRAVLIIASIFAAAIYLTLIAVPAYKDGVNERLAIKNKKSGEVPKFRWLGIGFVLWGVMLIPSITYLTGNITASVYRLIDGAVYPLSLLLTGDELEPLFFSPFVFMGFYLLSAPACYIGFWCGLNDKLNASKIMYK